MRVRACLRVRMCVRACLCGVVCVCVCVCVLMVGSCPVLVLASALSVVIFITIKITYWEYTVILTRMSVCLSDINQT